MADEVKVSPELGSSGLNRWGGDVVEEFLPELQGQRGRKIYREMADNDAVVGAILFATEMALREVPWFTRPQNEDAESVKAAKLISTSMQDMSHTWRDFVSEILTMLRDGFSFFEVVYKRRDGKNSKHNDGLIGWRKFGYRPWDSLYQWEFDTNGGITAFVQSAPPDYKIIRIPIDKGILFRTRREKNNPEGKSILRTSYRAHYFKKNLEALEGISLERVFAGLPVIEMPPAASTGSGTGTDESKAKDIVRKIRVDEQAGLVLPANWKFSFAAPQGNRGIEAYNTAIIRYRQEIMMSVMATFIALGIEKAGSYALAKESRDFFQIALQGWLDNICETINEFAVPKLLQLNGFNGTEAAVAVGEVGQIDLEKLSNYIMRLAQIGAITPDSQLEKYLRESADLPPLLDEEQEIEAGKSLAGEDWHPSIKRRPQTIREILRLQGGLERHTRSFFRRQGQWLEQNWEMLLPSKSAISKQEWDDWDLAFAQEIESDIGRAMEAGAGVAQEKVPGLTVDWTLQNPKAQKFVREHALKLAININKTTIDKLRASLATGLSLGENRDQLAQRVKVVIEDATRWRARMIAQTEVMNGYNTGALQLYKEGNIKKKEWLAGAGACGVCANLNGTIIGIDEKFDGEDFGMVDSPALHPNCRCTVAGVVE